MKLAYVTYQDQGAYASGVENEDQKLLQFLKEKGLDITEEIWDDPQVNWESYDLAILKSPWDYFDKIDQFYQWLEKLKLLKVRLLNPVETIEWNSDKHYLMEIAAAGLAVTPTLYLERGTKPNLSESFDSLGSDTLIVKPCVSGGSKNTIKVTRGEYQSSTEQIHRFLEEEAYMVQPFLNEIETQGEWSFLFFNGKFSHALLKKARPGDFRVQHYLGGTIHSEEAPSHLLGAAEEYVKRFAKGCLYARVDGLEVNGTFTLMELELIEPFLFLFTNPDSYANYYQALQELMIANPAPLTLR